MVTTLQFVQSSVLTTRIRLARNLVGFPFPTKMRTAHGKEILHLVEKALNTLDPEEYQRFAHYLDCEAHTDVWRELFPSWHITEREENKDKFRYKYLL